LKYYCQMCGCQLNLFGPESLPAPAFCPACDQSMEDIRSGENPGSVEMSTIKNLPEANIIMDSLNPASYPNRRPETRNQKLYQWSQKNAETAKASTVSDWNDKLKFSNLEGQLFVFQGTANEVGQEIRTLSRALKKVPWYFFWRRRSLQRKIQSRQAIVLSLCCEMEDIKNELADLRREFTKEYPAHPSP
jgi:hypothetical protein